MKTRRRNSECKFINWPFWRNSPIFHILLCFIKPFFRASDELDTIEERKNKEIQHYDAELRLMKSKMAALQSSLDQKTVENEELVAICDQLMEGNK